MFDQCTDDFISLSTNCRWKYDYTYPISRSKNTGALKLPTSSYYLCSSLLVILSYCSKLVYTIMVLSRQEHYNSSYGTGRLGPTWVQTDIDIQLPCFYKNRYSGPTAMLLFSYLVTYCISALLLQLGLCIFTGLWQF